MEIAFDQLDLRSTSEFERMIDRRCQVLVSRLETGKKLCEVWDHIALVTGVCLKLLLIYIGTHKLLYLFASFLFNLDQSRHIQVTAS